MLYRVNRLTAAHNTFRKAAYAFLMPLPDSLKYGAGGAWRRFRRPYNLLKRGDTVIQIGAPWDTLRAGRSRAVHFGRIVGDVGRVFAIEPELGSVQQLATFAKRHAMSQIEILRTGVWDCKTRLRFLHNPNHPAANLVEEVIVSSRDRSAFEESFIDVDTLDSILSHRATTPIAMLSITTNGSELRILKGARMVLAKTKYVSTITTDVGKFLFSLGFVPFGRDDRGYVYKTTRDD